MTKLEIIEETVKYYKTHRRGYNKEGGYCEYRNNKGSKCAIGRVLTEEGLNHALMNNWGSIDGVCVSDAYLDTILKPGYEGHEIDFWSDLQDFHDASNHWKETIKGNMLTGQGITAYNHLRQMYAS